MSDLHREIVRVISLIVFTVALMGFCGYISGSTFWYQWGQDEQVSMSLNTSIILMLCAGFVFALTLKRKHAHQG
jgi:hypothetical protein